MTILLSVFCFFNNNPVKEFPIQFDHSSPNVVIRMSSMPNLQKIEEEEDVEMASESDSQDDSFYMESEDEDSEGEEFNEIEETNQQIRAFLQKLRSEGNMSLVTKEVTE